MQDIDKIYKPVFASKTDERLPEFKDGKTLLVGIAGCGKDYMINKLIDTKRWDKVLFFGREDNYKEYLKDKSFKKFSFEDKVELENNYISIITDDKDLNKHTHDKHRLTQIITQAVDKGYFIIFNEIVWLKNHEEYISLIKESANRDIINMLVTSQTFEDENIKYNIDCFENIIVMKNNDFPYVEMFGGKYPIAQYRMGQYLQLEQDDIELLNRAIKIVANGNESDFCEYSDIKASTIRTWRKRESIPNDKKLLLEWIIRCYKTEQKLKIAENFFEVFSK